jgi:hypothetical protein
MKTIKAMVELLLTRSESSHIAASSMRSEAAI